MCPKEMKGFIKHQRLTFVGLEDGINNSPSVKRSSFRIRKTCALLYLTVLDIISNFMFGGGCQFHLSSVRQAVRAGPQSICVAGRILENSKVTLLLTFTTVIFT